MKSYSAHEIAMLPDWSELRVSKGLSLEQISNITNLPERKLEAIERHNFAELGTATFATGYIRSYAKILKEDPEIFVQVYKDAMAPEPNESPAITQSMKAVAQRHSNMWQKFSVLHVVGFGIIVWVAVVFLRDEAPIEAPSEEDKAIAQTMAPAPTKMEEIVETRDAEISDASDEPSSDIAVTQVESVAAAEPAPVPETGLQSTVGEPSAPASAAPVSLAASAEPQGLEASVNTDVLEFIFADDCWVEVKAADDRVLIAETKRKGDNLRLFGQAPFRIHLGNARAVNLTLNGETVKIEPKSGRNTLRFVASS